MRLGIFTRTFDGAEPDALFEKVREAGFEAVHWNWSGAGLASMPDRIGTSDVERVRAAARSSGLPVIGVSGTYNMAHPDEAVRLSGSRSLREIIRTAGQIGTDLVTLCTGSRNPADQWASHPDNDTPEAWIDMVGAMEEAVEAASEFGVYLGVEPELSNVVNSPAKAKRLMDDLGTDRIRIVFDPANLFEVVDIESQRDIVSGALDLLGEHIAVAHAKDRAADGSFVAAGHGVLDYDHYLHLLRQSSDCDILVAHGLGAGEATGVADFLRAALRRAGASD